MSHFDSSKILCIHCATFFEPLDKDSPTCPNCGSLIDLEQYDKLLHYASAAVRYGYVYRRTCENIYEKEQSVNVRFSLPVDEILAFAGLAALSGMIGNLSYDIVKAVLKKIQQYSSVHKTAHNSGILGELINNPQEFNQFVSYLAEYRDGFPNLSPEVKQAIFDEMSTHTRMAVEDKIKEAVKQTTTDKTPRKEFVDQVQRLQKTFPQEEQKEIELITNPPDKNEFEGFWQLYE